MKNLRLIPAFLMVLFLSATAFANNDDKKAVKPEAAFAYSVHAIKDSQKFALAFKNRTDAKVQVRIYSEAGVLLFKEVQNRDEMYKMYDLSKIGAGEYKVVIESGDFRAEEMIAVGIDKNIDLPESAFEAIISSDTSDKDKMRLGFSNAKASVKINITDKNGAVVYSNTVAGVSHYNQRFDMSALSPGIYYVSLDHEGQAVERSYAVEK